MAYDYQGALNAGANINDVLGYVAKQTGYDAQGAIKAGANPTDVLKYMSNLPMQGSSQPAQQGILSKIGNGIMYGVKAVGNALTFSEQGLGQDIAGAVSNVLPTSVTGQATLNQANKQNQETLNSALAQIRQAQVTGKDPSQALKVVSSITNQPINSVEDLYPALKKSNLQVVGDAAGTLLDILSAGTYGTAAKGAETGKLLVKSGGAVENLASKAGIATSQKIITPAVEAGSKTLGTTLKNIGTQTAIHSATGAATGYGYDVSQNLQGGATGASALKPGMGTLLGAAIPAVIGGVRAGVAITKETAPRFINSLIKPSKANFSYGKNPGETVSQMGITGNSISDFANNINTAKQEIGQQIGAVYDNPANANLRVNATPQIEKIDTAINDAAKGGKNNQGIVNTLTNIKNALLYEHSVNSEGSIVKSGTEPRNLSSLSPQEAFALKQEIASHTRFTGSPSDDKTVNSILKSMYGGLTDTLNATVGKNNPEITSLNEKYAGLTSAELATRNRDIILQRSNQISLPVKVGVAGALIAAPFTGGASVTTVLLGIGAGSLEKALESTAVKTRVAAWLGNTSPSTISRVLAKNPAIGTVLARALPKFASQIKR